MIAERIQKLRTALPQGVALVAVSKFHPVERLREAYDAGQRVFAESRPQELSAKVPQLPDDIEWHFIGHLQTNKLKKVLPYVSLVQSVDSLHLLEAIDRWGAEQGRVLDVLLEVHIASDETKQGFLPDEVIGMFQDWAGAGNTGASMPAGWQWNHVRIRGLMGMATLTDDAQVIEADFARLQALFLKIRLLLPEWTQFDQLSIGMSADWPLALRHGATMVRIGTDIFGTREY